MARSLLAYVMWQQGYPDQARTEIERALEEAERLGHSPTEAFAHVVAGVTALIFGRDADVARNHAAAIRPLGDVARFYGSFVDVMGPSAPSSDAAEPSAQVAAMDPATPVARPGMGQAAVSLVRAGMLAKAGHPDVALLTLDRAAAWIEETGVRLTEADVWRLARRTAAPGEFSPGGGGRVVSAAGAGGRAPARVAVVRTACGCESGPAPASPGPRR